MVQWLEVLHVGIVGLFCNNAIDKGLNKLQLPLINPELTIYSYAAWISSPHRKNHHNFEYFCALN